MWGGVEIQKPGSRISLGALREHGPNSAMKRTVKSAFSSMASPVGGRKHQYRRPICVWTCLQPDHAMEIVRGVVCWPFMLLGKAEAWGWLPSCRQSHRNVYELFDALEVFLLDRLRLGWRRPDAAQFRTHAKQVECYQRSAAS